MDAKQIVGGFVLLIAIFLLLKDAKGTNTVITGLSGGITNTVLALQGRNPAASPTNIAGIPQLGSLTV